jgi:hypothetical protein
MATCPSFPLFPLVSSANRKSELIGYGLDGRGSSFIFATKYKPDSAPAQFPV